MSIESLGDRGHDRRRPGPGVPARHPGSTTGGPTPCSRSSGRSAPRSRSTTGPNADGEITDEEAREIAGRRRPVRRGPRGPGANWSAGRSRRDDLVIAARDASPADRAAPTPSATERPTWPCWRRPSRSRPGGRALRPGRSTRTPGSPRPATAYLRPAEDVTVRGAGPGLTRLVAGSEPCRIAVDAPGVDARELRRVRLRRRAGHGRPVHLRGRVHHPRHRRRRTCRSGRRAGARPRSWSGAGRVGPCGT